MKHLNTYDCTKRIQPARGWCATVRGGGLCKLYPPTPPLRRPGHPVFWGSQPCVPTAWLAERLLLAGDIEFGCLPIECGLCWSGGRDAWQGFSREIGLSDPFTATRRRGRSTTTTTIHMIILIYHIVAMGTDSESILNGTINAN